MFIVSDNQIEDSFNEVLIRAALCTLKKESESGNLDDTIPL